MPSFQVMKWMKPGLDYEKNTICFRSARNVYEIFEGVIISVNIMGASHRVPVVVPKERSRKMVDQAIYSYI